MSGSIRFIGIGDFGNKVSTELSKVYEGLRDGLFDEEDERYDAVQDHLHTHSFPSAEMAAIDVTDDMIILAGSVRDGCWQEARNTVHESRPFFMLTIGIDYEQEIEPDAFQPLPNECIVFPDPALFDPVKLAQLALEIFLMHTSWQVCSRGSLVGYDFVDTKNVLAGKVAKARKMTSDKEHYRQNLTKFLSENKAELSQAPGILASFWGVSLPELNELCEETARLLIPDVNFMFTLHDLPEDGPAVMVTLFMAF